jgi:two-component system, NarL family, sensor kinase
MYCRILLLLLLCSLTSGTYSQLQVSRQDAAEISRIRGMIKQSPENQEYVDAILDLVKIFQTHNYPEDSIRPWLQKAEYISDKLDYRAGLRNVYRSRGVTYETITRDYPKALYWYESALRLSENDAHHHELFTSILNLNFYLGDYVNAMTTAAKGLRMAETAADDRLTAHYYNVIGFIHLRQGHALPALQAYEQYHMLGQKMKDTLTIADAYNSLAEAYLLDSRFEDAIGYLSRARKLYHDLDAKNKLYKQDRIPYTYFKTGFAYGSQGDYPLALTYVQKAIEYTKKTSCNLYDVASYYIYAGNLYQQVNDHTRSFHMLRAGLSLARQIDHKEDIRDAYLYLHQLFARTSQFDSAYLYYSLYDGLKDSISNEKTRREIRQIEASYKVEKKDHEIELLLQQKALEEARTNRKLLYRNLVIIFFMLVTVIIAFILNRKELRRKNLLQQEINQRQNEIFNIVSSTQEQERKRIAQDLHDGMGTLLSAAKLKLSALSGQEEGPVRDTIRILDDAVTELRNISHNIMPATLSRIGLVGALQSFFGRLSNPGINFHFSHHGFSGRIDEEKEIILYRVILELVNNVVKHSGADAVTIQLIKFPDHINVIVEDNGRGIQQSLSDDQGIGLKNISSRIGYLKGSFTIDSGVNGTTAIIDIPA